MRSRKKIAAGKYGLSKVVDALFTFTLNHTDDVRGYFDTLLNEVELIDRLIDENDEICEKFLFDINFERAHNLLNKKRMMDKKFLKDSLNLNK